MTTPEKLGDDIKCSKISAIIVLQENNENETFFSPKHMDPSISCYPKQDK